MTRANIRLAEDLLRAVLLSIVAAVVLAFFSLGVLQLAQEARAVEDLSFNDIFPSPRAMWDAWEQHQTLLLRIHIPETMWETLAGLSIAIVLGVVIAALMDFSPLLRLVLYPLLVISQTIPIFAIAILLDPGLWLRQRPEDQRGRAVLLFPGGAEHILRAAIRRSRTALAAARDGRELRSQIWLKVRLPAAMPSFFSGLRIAATYSVVGAIFGEYITAQAGLGVFLKRSYGNYALDQVYVAIILTAALSMLLVLLVNLIERLALRWYYTTRRSSWRGPGIY